jgi:hypothetical protein
MLRQHRFGLIGVVGMSAFLAAPGAQAQTVDAALSGYQEVPAISSTGFGTFRARLDEKAGTLSWTLVYAGLEADASQAHIHFGQAGVNGGVSAFLCSNLGNGPAGTPACPSRAGEVSGVISAAAVVGPATQGISPGEFAELVAAIRARTTYVNVHSTAWPGGEIRGQVK